MIHKIIQGRDHEKDLMLYFLVGPLLTDETVHTHLGSSITSKPDDVWYIDVAKEGSYRGGFAVVRYSTSIDNGKEFHVRYLYAPERYYEKRFIQQILEDAAHSSVPIVYAYDYTGSPVWSRAGFDLTKYSNNREAAIWTKTLDPVAYPALYTP